MTARVARGRQAGGRPAGKSVRSSGGRRSKSPGMLESVGFPPGVGRRVGGWIFAGMIVAVVVAALLAFRVPQLIGTAMSRGVGEAGFTMSRVEIRGAHRVSRLAIYNIAFEQNLEPMPSVDLQAVRARLLEFGWIKEARVSRRLPDTLVVDVIERTPAAIWQNNQQLSLIDSEGIVLEPIRIEAMPDLPLVIGPAANRHLAALQALLATSPHLRPQIEGAAWVGGRRWDIRFQTGEVLALPEGNEAAGRAIRQFAGMDQQTQLLGRGFVRFDMRDPRRMIVRVSREPGTSVPELVPSERTQSAPDLSRTI